MIRESLLTAVLVFGSAMAQQPSVPGTPIPSKTAYNLTVSAEPCNGAEGVGFVVSITDFIDPETPGFVITAAYTPAEKAPPVRITRFIWNSHPLKANYVFIPIPESATLTGLSVQPITLGAPVIIAGSYKP
jgi:hypothetical protein